MREAENEESLKRYGRYSFMFGSAWVLAGLNLIGDTSMSGERLWAAVGAATVAGAIALLATTNRARSFLSD
jgi:hypothetical protein